MNTFLPFSNFHLTAEVLDRKRLGKQRVECLQILRTLKAGPITDGKKTPWFNHPAVQMWKGYETGLMLYLQEICREWTRLGYKDTCLEKARELGYDYEGHCLVPDWIGNERFHLSHQSNLLRKDPEHYGNFFYSVPDDLPYIWPTKENL